MSGLIRSRDRGKLDKCIGDAIMAFWGAPMDDAQHARNALVAALDMQRAWAPCARATGARSSVMRTPDAK